MNPVVLHVIRPFATEAEFLEHEAWTIDARGMLLVDQRDLEPDSVVVFDVALASGAKVIRAEGRVIGYLAATDERPGGLRVRFRRFGAQTKAFIDRAVAARGQELSSGMSLRPGLAPAGPDAARLSQLETQPLSPRGDAAIQNVGVEPPRQEEPSGIHARPLAPVVTPTNRDELLERLRARSSRT
jgi:hypothetical protein